MRRNLLEKLNALRAERRPALTLATRAEGVVALYDPSAAHGEKLLWRGRDLGPEAEAALRQGGLLAVEAAGETLYLTPYLPPLRLLLIGAVHIAQALAPMAQSTGYDVTVIDPRTAFATEQRFPDIARRTDWPDEALAALAPDSRTAIVTLTHDPKLDDPALQAALASPAFYIAALGSKKTHAARLSRLREAGYAEADIARIEGPAGLAIGAASPAEIAVSILAAMTQALRRPPQADGPA